MAGEVVEGLRTDHVEEVDMERNPPPQQLPKESDTESRLDQDRISRPDFFHGFRQREEGNPLRELPFAIHHSQHNAMTGRPKSFGLGDDALIGTQGDLAQPGRSEDPCCPCRWVHLGLLQWCRIILALPGKYGPRITSCSPYRPTAYLSNQ